MITRRTLLKSGGLAALGSLTLGTVACGEKLSFYVSTVIGALETLSPLLPNSSGLISKAIGVAKEFDTAYRAGKFESSVTLLANLGALAEQIRASVGNASDTIKRAIAVGTIALNVIATIVKSQMKDPVVAAMVASRTDPAAQSQKAMIERMADEKMIEMIFAASKP